MKVALLETARRQLEGTLVHEIAGKSFFPLQVKYHSINTIVCWEKCSILLRHTNRLGLFLRAGTSAATHRETLSILNDPNLKHIVSD